VSAIIGQGRKIEFGVPTLLNSKGAPNEPISTATAWEFVTSNRSWMPSLSATQRRVILRRDVVGRVGLKLAAARVAPETAAGVSGFRAVDESLLICTKVSKTATYIHKKYRRPKLWSLLLELQIWHLVAFSRFCGHKEQATRTSEGYIACEWDKRTSSRVGYEPGRAH
jgi:hypothetical protein